MVKSAKILYDGKWAAILSETDNGYEFEYTPEYLNDPARKAVSLTFPLQRGSWLSKTLFSFFDGLIPEGWLLDIATEHWKIKSNDRFELLLASCRDTIGAVTVLPLSKNE